MSSLGLERVPEAAEGAKTVAGDGSVLDRIRALYEEAEQAKYLDLGLPGQVGELLRVRYEVPEDDAVDFNGKTPQEINLDSLIACCRCLVMREGEKWEPLTHNGVPVQFDETLAEIMGWEGVDTARDVALRAFNGAPKSDAAVAQHVMRLTSWLSGGVVDEERLLGEG